MRHSTNTRKNPAVLDWTSSFQRRSNVAFFAEALRDMKKKQIGNHGVGVIGLIGRRDRAGILLRHAQAALRWDERPSRWSHAFLMAAPAQADRELLGTPIWEVTLQPQDTADPGPERNGVQEGRLGDFDDPVVNANVALLVVTMTDQEAQRVLERAREPNIDRVRYDLWKSLGRWQAYLWATQDRINPLEHGFPMFCSSYVEMAYEAIQLDLTPGASEHNSAPEHLWNAALWWHGAYRELGHPISGYAVVRDGPAVPLEPSSSRLPDHLGSFGRAKPPATRSPSYNSRNKH